MFQVDDKILQRAVESNKASGASHASVVSILRALKPQTGVEIGVAFGGNAEGILTNTAIARLYLVDPYMHYRNYHDAMNLKQEDFDRTYLHVIQKLQPFGGRYC